MEQDSDDDDLVVAHSVHVQPLDLTLLVEERVLGSSLDFTVPGFTLQLHMPIRSPEGGLTAPEPLGDRDVSEILLEGEWGSVYTQHSVPLAEVHGVVFTMSALMPPLPDGWDPSHTVTSEALEELSKQTRGWSKRWLRWVGALTSQAIDVWNPGLASRSLPGVNQPKWLHFEDASRFVLQSVAIHMEVHMANALDATIHSERPINLESLAFAMERASADDEVPMPLELRADAHIAARRPGGQRIALAQIGTAAEAWLTTALSLPQGHSRTLGGLVTDAQGAGLPLPSDAKTGLVEVRNDALHRGLTPSHADLVRALEIGEELWALADPTMHAMVSRLELGSRVGRMGTIVMYRPT